MTQNIREQTQIFIFGRKIFEFKLFFATDMSLFFYLLFTFQNKLCTTYTKYQGWSQKSILRQTSFSFASVVTYRDFLCFSATT